MVEAEMAYTNVLNTNGKQKQGNFGVIANDWSHIIRHWLHRFHMNITDFVCKIGNIENVMEQKRLQV